MLYRVLLILFLSTNLSSQSKINFSDISWRSAKQRAKIENKLIFIDSYASYCIPCKKMEVEFKNPAVIEFFNKNFINVKVDMEGPNGQEYKSKFQIVFLPTFVFVDSDGNEKTKIDHLLSAAELLSIGKYIHNKHFDPNFKPVTSQPVKTRPFKKETPLVNTKSTVGLSSTTAPPSPDKNEKILYIMGEETNNLPPAILRQEAYFRMQLMDGSHVSASEKYLATQSNWSTRENMAFIFDFLYSCNSKTFKHLIDNRALYNKQFGAQQVDKSIRILVNKQLERAHPKPSLEEAEKLYILLNEKEAKKLASEYYLSRLYLENKFEHFLNLARKFQDIYGFDNQGLNAKIRSAENKMKQN